MNTLRAKIMALLVIAIFVVLCLATAATVTVLGMPSEKALIGDVAAQIKALFPVLDELPAQAGQVGDGLMVAREPPTAPVDASLTAALHAALTEQGAARAIMVLKVSSAVNRSVAIPLRDGRWVTMRVPGLPPPISPALVLAGWLGLVMAGVGLIAIFFANRIIRPLALLRDTVTAVGRDGMLPILPETGPSEVRATAQAINLLSARLREAMESRMRLVAAAGHDFRTPLTRMRLRAEFMDAEEDKTAWVRDIDELSDIADSAIQLVREEVAAGGHEPLALDQLVTELVEELQGLDLTIRCAACAPVRVAAARLALTRALRNLMINAATHGQAATVSVAAQGQWAEVLIEDIGPGIPQPLLEKVFEPFFRVDIARRRSVPGAGLGLAIAREIVVRQGGRLEIANRTDGGLRQCVVLPQAEAADKPRIPVGMGA